MFFGVGRAMEGKQEEMTGTKDAPQKPNLLHGGKFHTFLSSTLQWTASHLRAVSTFIQFAGGVLIPIRAKFYLLSFSTAIKLKAKY